jgi:DNA helicase-2/ATP-dependent DNA helicase PcrA
VAPRAVPPDPAPEAHEGAEFGLRFHKGLRVRHPEFGEGDVIRSELRGEDEAVTVDFASVGLRRVLARASRLAPFDGETN